MTFGDTFGPAIASVLVSRMVVFAPSLKRVPESTWEFPTQWGQARVTGRIGGTHRKILDTLFGYALKVRRNRNGTIDLLIDPYTIRRLVGGSGKTWIEDHLADMNSASVRFNGNAEGGSIVADWQDSTRTAAFPSGQLKGRRGETRKLLVVTISAAWMRVYDGTLAVRYKRLLPVINGFKSGAAHALALHVITHRDYNRDLLAALRDVGAVREGMSRRTVNKVIARVLGEMDRFEALGIRISDATVFYQQHQHVRFTAGTTGSEEAAPMLQASVPILQGSAPILQAPAHILPASQEGQETQENEEAAGPS
jgi:hypothetical protein